MPERWQRELRKLREEEMPPRIRERAERGPQRDLPHDGRQRLVAGLVAFAVFIAAGAFAWRAFDRDGPTEPAVDLPRPVVVELSADPFAGTMRYGGTAQRGIKNGSSWETREGTIGSSGPFAIVFDSYVRVPAGTPITIRSDATELSASLEHMGNPPGPAMMVALEAGTGILNATSGRYRFQVTGTWDRGGATFAFGVQIVEPGTDALEIPEVLHLECTSQTASVDATIVRARSDGVHIVVDASDEVRGVDIVTGPGAQEFSGMGFFVDGRDAHVLPIEPGSWHVGCFGGGRSGVGPSDVGTERAASFTVVDPDGFYAPVELACEEFTTRLFAVTGTPSAGIADAYEPSPVTVEESAAAVPGILPTDVVRVAGYADGPGFKSGPLYSVLRDGRTVARLHVPVEVGSTWGVSVDACPGSGIGPDAPPGAAGPTPDTAVVRCLESRTEVATPIVATQADGLHIEVQNPYGSQALVIVGGWERDRIFTIPIADQAASIVVPVRPGHVQFSCRSNAETGGNSDPYEDRHSDGLQLQDRSGHFLPYAPGCDSSEEVPLEPPRDFVEPAGESFVRGDLSGVLSSDTVERAGYLAGRNDEGPWRIVRDGEVVAQVEFPSLEGIVCRGAGITGRR